MLLNWQVGRAAEEVRILGTAFGPSVQLHLLTGPSLLEKAQGAAFAAQSLPHPTPRVGTSCHTPRSPSTAPSPNMLPGTGPAVCLRARGHLAPMSMTEVSFFTNRRDPRLVLSPVRQSGSGCLALLPKIIRLDHNLFQGYCGGTPELGLRKLPSLSGSCRELAASIHQDSVDSPAQIC